MYKQYKIYNSGFGVLSLMNFWKGYTVGWDYGSLVYCFLSENLQARNTYRDSSMGVSFTYFLK